MGQRLVVKLIKDGEVVAQSYKHWSGYTEIALENATRILCKYEDDYEHLRSLPKELQYIELLVLDAEGIAPEEKEKLIKKYPDYEFPEFIDRNEGFIVLNDKDLFPDLAIEVNLDENFVNDDFIETFIDSLTGYGYNSFNSFIKEFNSIECTRDLLYLCKIEELYLRYYGGF